MLTMTLLICELIFFMGLFVFVSSRKHLLSMLLILEIIALVLFVLIFMFLSMLYLESYFLVVFLTFSVCEGSLGLSINIHNSNSCKWLISVI